MCGPKYTAACWPPQGDAVGKPIDTDPLPPYNVGHVEVHVRIGGATKAAVLGGIILTAALLVCLWWAQAPAAKTGAEMGAGILRPPPTREPLVPTPLPAFRATAAPQARATLGTSAGGDATTAAAGAEPLPAGSAPARVGVGLPVGPFGAYDWGKGLPGWYVNWRALPDPTAPSGVRFAHLIYVFGDTFQPAVETVKAIAQADPGALWLVGNEPDVAWQGNATPEQYAGVYHELYLALKEADPSAQVAIGGVSQPTPLRIAYLDRVLQAYRSRFGEAMPVDVWNVHAFILREEADSWGVGIPPGMGAGPGELYEIADHVAMDIFRVQIVRFRQWMADRGFRDKPLIVSEYGVLMPESYGFPPEVVTSFLVDTFDYFLTARDPATGFPEDDNRLVQAFCWYSAADTTYPTPNLFDPETRAVTPAGEMFRAYVEGLP